MWVKGSSTSETRNIQASIKTTGVQMRNPVMRAFMLDVTGFDHKTLDEKMKHRTTDVPAGVDGAILMDALKTFANWLTWQVIKPGLVLDRQFLHGFFCRSGLDRSVATAILFCAVVFAAWGIKILPQFMAFKDGANNGYRQAHTRECKCCAQVGPAEATSIGIHAQKLVSKPTRRSLEGHRV